MNKIFDIPQRPHLNFQLQISKLVRGHIAGTTLYSAHEDLMITALCHSSVWKTYPENIQRPASSTTILSTSKKDC